MDISRSEQLIIACPDIRVENLGPDDEFFILACDGIWEVLENQSVVNFIRCRLGVKNPSEILKELFDVCMSRSRDGHGGSGLGLDNMTAILVLFKQ